MSKQDQDLATFLEWQKDQSPAASYAMIQKLMPYISHSIIASGGDPENPALKAKACMMALQYMKRYNPEHSTVQNYIYGQLRGLNRVIGNDNNIIQIPESVVLARKQIDEAENELFDQLGYYPSTAEIANYTGMPVKKIAKLRSIAPAVSEGTVNALENVEGMHTKMLGSTSGDDAWNEYVYDTLSDRQKSVMERLYGMHGYKPQSPENIAKELKISRAAVSQHKKAIDKLLDDDARYGLFEE